MNCASKKIIVGSRESPLAKEQVEIFLKVLDFSKSSKVYVPKIGLSDGIIREIFRSKYSSKEK